jgi:hypothetical protein
MPRPVIESGRTVAQVPAPTATKRAALCERIADRVAPVSEFGQEQHMGAAVNLARVGIDIFRLPRQGDPRRLAARIELETNRLQNRIFHAPIHQPDGERNEPMHPRPTALQ